MTDTSGTSSSSSMFKLFLRRFWQPPRPHGEVVEDRTVSFLELDPRTGAVVDIATRRSD